MRFLAILPIAALLVGCGETARPLVEMTGVDANKYLVDQMDCERQMRQTFFYPGNFLNACMEKKGYKVLPPGG